MRLGPAETKLVLACAERAELVGAEEVRRTAAAVRRARWLSARKGVDPGGEAELRAFCAKIVGDVMDGRLPISGAWAEAVVGLEEALRAPAEAPKAEPEAAPETEEPELVLDEEEGPAAEVA